MNKAGLKQSSDMTGVIADLTGALNFFHKTGFDLDVTQILLARCRSYLALGNDIAAERDLLSALHEHRIRLRRALRGDSVGPVGFDAQSVYRELIAFEVHRRGRIGDAFDYAEEARSRAFTDNVLSGSTDDPESAVRLVESRHPALPLSELKKHLPASTVIIEYIFLGDSLVAWVVNKDTIQFRELHPKLSGLSIDIQRFRSYLMRNDLDRSREIGAMLYRELVAPLLGGIDSESRIVFVPDGPLQQLPFSALWMHIPLSIWSKRLILH